MLGKYGDASSSSMINLENGLRNRVLYHQNMMGMNLMAEFYHNPTATVSASVGVATSHSQKMLNSLTGNILVPGVVPSNHQQQIQHSNGTSLVTLPLGAATTAGVASSQQPLTLFQCQVCQKTFLSSTMLVVHMKTHDADYAARDETAAGGYMPPSAGSGTSSKTSPPSLLTQPIIKSEYVGGTLPPGGSRSGSVPLPDGGQNISGHHGGGGGGGIVKQFDCHICHKSFMTLMNLNLHMKIHENEQKMTTHTYSHPIGGGAGSGANSIIVGSGGGLSYHHHSHHHGQQQQQQQHHVMLATTVGGATSAVASLPPEGLCQICHKTFNSTEQFTAHMKMHEDEFKNRALYHSSATAAPGNSNGVAQPPNNPFSATHGQFTPHVAAPVQQEPTRGHRCPICHKMSSNIIEHIKQHEGQLSMGGTNGGGGASPEGSPTNTARGTDNATPGYQLNEESQSSQGDDSENGADGAGTDPRKQHECLICRKKFCSSGNLAIHIRVHSGEKPFKCSVCGKGFIQSNNLATHMKTHTGEKPYACTICGKNFSQSNNLKTHIRTHTGEKPYACTICGKRFNQKNNLTTHMRTHQLVCMVCGVQFAHPTDLANHMKFHNDEKPYICSVCNKVYLNLDELTEHMKKTHNQIKPYRCHICDKTFTQSNNLKTHIKTHIFQDPYKCQMCSRSFQKEDDYSQHMLVHTADKPYECTYCGKRFIQSNNLKTHVRTHTGEKPYTCAICAKTFNQKNNLNTHMRIHTGEKPFECTICDKRFNQSNNLNKHIKTHGQEKDQQHVS